MATWKKVIVSGSNAELNQITASGGVNATLPNTQQVNFVTYNTITGQLGYFGTGSLTATTASYVTSSGVNGPFGANSILTASYATTASFVIQAVSASYATFSATATSASYATFAATSTTSTTSTTAQTASTVTVTDTTTGGIHFLAFTSGSSGAQTLRVDSNGPTINLLQNSISASSFTGSLQGTATTASYATFAATSTSASYATFAATSTSSSYATFAATATSASYATQAASAYTASYVAQATSASYATFAATSTSSSFAGVVGSIATNIIGNTDNRVLTATGFGTINGEGNLTFDNTTLTVTGNAVITNNLTVQGTASFQNATNLEVADRFVLFASGSNAASDGGIVIQQGTQNVGELYGYDSATNRWGFTSSFNAGSPVFLPAAYITTTETGSVVPTAAPLYGGPSNGHGNIYVKADTGDIFIYA